ncbi:MAG TPA: hypothetical protein DCX45_03555 [Acinetobacter junii]|nr:hypothetical protein [Acinetobacter junii]
MKQVILFIILFSFCGLAQNETISLPLKTVQLFAAPIYLYGGNSLIADCDSSNTFYVTLSENAGLTISDMVSGQIINIWVTNTASNYTLAFTSPSITWKDNTAPTITLGAKTDLITIEKVGSIYYGTYVQSFY